MRHLLLALALLSSLVAGCGRRQEPLDLGPDISRDEILFLHNRERMVNGDLKTLAYDAGLERTAQAWAEAMAQRGSLTHSRLDIGATKFFRMGENIAMGYTTTDGVVKGWMDSPGHRRNILDPKFTKAGFGYARRVSDVAPYWAAQFGGD